MIRDLLCQQQNYLEHYFSKLDTLKTEEFIDRLFQCKGTVFCCGVGKSGHIAQKIAATFLSTGTKAFFLDPTHAVHGDLGCIREEDLVLILSKSGESQELLDLLPFVRKRGAFIFAIVSNERARLAKAADAFILLHVERELCPYDLAPTTSTVAQLLFGDLLAMALMRKRQVSLQEYALNHPGGLIGRRISLRVADLMVKGEMLPFALPHQRLIEVLHELSAKQCGCLLIVDEEKRLKGIFTDGDLRRALELKGAHALEHLLEHIMTLHPRFTLPGTLAIEAMRQMEEDVSKLITVLPVVEEDQVVGLLRMHDILQAGFYTAPAPQK